ncbi:MAG TPA: SHOCT domain-containing protein [Steroidobacteraceae bacterium]|nr:SHOCT domain-containing protein [Steroidobacteraceae bacterium]
MENGTNTARLTEGRRRRLLGAAPAHLVQPGGCKLALGSGAVMLVCAAVAWGATGEPRGSVVLWSGDDEWVKIEPQDDPAAVPNDQPVQLGLEAIKNALGALQVHLVDPDTGTESRRPVFTVDELGNLTPRVASGLAKAGPRQDVTFSTIDGRSLAAGGLVRKPGVNAGRVFYNDGRLNVIFGELQSPYRKRNVYGQRSEDFTPRRQGSRSEATAQKWVLAAGPGLAFHPANDGGIRSDWVVIDTAVARAAVPAASQPGDAPTRQAESAPVTGAPMTGAPVTSAPVTDAAAAPAAAAESAPTQNANLEQRLRKLKELKEQGLISDEVYRAKMQEILSEL